MNRILFSALILASVVVSGCSGSPLMPSSLETPLYAAPVAGPVVAVPLVPVVAPVVPVPVLTPIAVPDAPFTPPPPIVFPPHQTPSDPTPTAPAISCPQYFIIAFRDTLTCELQCPAGMHPILTDALSCAVD